MKKKKKKLCLRNYIVRGIMILAVINFYGYMLAEMIIKFCK